MTTIIVYDETAKVLEKLADKLDVSVAEIVDSLVFDYGEELEQWQEKV